MRAMTRRQSASTEPCYLGRPPLAGAGGGALAGMGTYALIGAGTAVAGLTAPAWGTAAAVAVVSTGASWAVTEGAKNIWDWFAD